MLWGFPLFIEAYSSFMSGFIEDVLIDKAEAAEFQILSAVFIRLL